jgi:hypothetical protein
MTAAYVTAAPPTTPAWRTVARVCLLCLEGASDPADLLPLVEAGDPFLRGAALCRAGRYDQALRVLPQSQYIGATLYRALAEHGCGRRPAARQLLAEAVRWLDAPSQANPRQTNRDRLSWPLRVEVGLLQREVEAALKRNP